MSYIIISPIRVPGMDRRPYYIAEITGNGKNLVNFETATGFFVNILYSADTVINSIQSRFNSASTIIPLQYGDPDILTEQNLDDDDNLRYGVEFTRAQRLYLSESGKVQDLLLDIGSIGTAGKIILEIETIVLIGYSLLVM